MKKAILSAFIWLFAFAAVMADDIVAADTLAYTATRVVDEPNPNNREYIFGIYGIVDGKEYKTQINYHADDMYGTFSDTDFDLEGSGKNYNFIRNADGSKFWIFKHLDVVVSNPLGGTHIEINGLIQDMNKWRRILITADIAAPAPTDTICLDLGRASVTPNTLLDYMLLKASNEEYSLVFGLSGYNELNAGTYYRTELIRPEFVKLPSDTIQASNAQFVIADSTKADLKSLCLDLLSTDNRLYRIAMFTDSLSTSGSSLPAANDTTMVDCGEHVYRIDYTKGIGYLGLVLGNEEVDVHVTLFNDMHMVGTFSPTLFDYEECYITTYNNNVVSFADIKMAELRMDSIENKVNIKLDVITIADKMYCFRATLPAMRALSNETVEYTANLDEALMVAFRMGEHAVRMQLQRYDELNEYDEIEGDGEIWDFSFAQEAIDGISGEYGYSAGTLETMEHIIYEKGSEILLSPMAGTLKITAGEELILNWPDETSEYHTHLYNIEAQFVAENNITYKLSASNMLICVDGETGDPVEFTEHEINGLNTLLEQQGYSIRKVMRNGMFLIEKEKHSYDASGVEVR